MFKQISTNNDVKIPTDLYICDLRKYHDDRSTIAIE